MITFAPSKNLQQMCKSELERLENDLKSYGKKISSSKQKSQDLLKKIGVLDKNGMLTSKCQ